MMMPNFLFYKVVVLSVVSDSELLLDLFETPSSDQKCLLSSKINSYYSNIWEVGINLSQSSKYVC